MKMIENADIDQEVEKLATRLEQIANKVRTGRIVFATGVFVGEEIINLAGGFTDPDILDEAINGLKILTNELSNHENPTCSCCGDPLDQVMH